MKLIIRRHQKETHLGYGLNPAIRFVLHAQVELTGAEKILIMKYQAGRETVLNAREHGLFDLFGQSTLTIAEFIRPKGITLEHRNVHTIMAGEELIKAGCVTIQTHLQTMASYGGEEIIDYPSPSIDYAAVENDEDVPYSAMALEDEIQSVAPLTSDDNAALHDNDAMASTNDESTEFEIDEEVEETNFIPPEILSSLQRKGFF